MKSRPCDNLAKTKRACERVVVDYLELALRMLEHRDA